MEFQQYMADCEAYMYSHLVVAIKLQLHCVVSHKTTSTPHWHLAIEDHKGILATISMRANSKDQFIVLLFHCISMYWGSIVPLVVLHFRFISLCIIVLGIYTIVVGLAHCIVDLCYPRVPLYWTYMVSLT